MDDTAVNNRLDSFVWKVILLLVLAVKRVIALDWGMIHGVHGLKLS